MSSRSLALIEKILAKVEYYFVPMTGDETNFFDLLRSVRCDLDNLTGELEVKMDREYPDHIIETIGFFR